MTNALSCALPWLDHFQNQSLKIDEVSWSILQTVITIISPKFMACYWAFRQGGMFSLFYYRYTSVLNDWILKLFETHNFYLRIFKTEKPQIIFAQRIRHSFNFIFPLLFRLPEAWFCYSFNVNYLGTAILEQWVSMWMKWKVFQLFWVLPL